MRFLLVELPPESKTHDVVKVQLWHDGAVSMSPETQHANLVGQAIENFAKKFVIDWNLANK
jgi:hypothetical protein